MATFIKFIFLKKFIRRYYKQELIVICYIQPVSLKIALLETDHSVPVHLSSKGKGTLTDIAIFNGLLLNKLHSLDRLELDYHQL